ncbi:sulfotransferase domain-containing protein [Nocardioides sp. AX2bis]|uniref:sulfotransferase domain-containing protein n=1 Tax=Nocardioides sp. AX2bis TaxID=2653157 RepID=UPI0012EFE0E5|nr:sulfotransferase domain-containing protein [Nocardioides sp. AX2bis]VXC52641.1 Sulfotransferase [Nocardioides sp. AX2bis]
MTAAERIKRVAPSLPKELARRGFRSWGAATSSRRPLPSYLIIGTKRGGTTSLWRNMQTHPQVVPMFPAAENLKSPHYFDINWDRSESWYRSYFPTEQRRERARRVAGLDGPVVSGDASPYYLFHPAAAGRAAQTVPGAKVIVLLRHPVDRAWSHFHERVGAGTETLEFEAALDAEDDRLRPARDRMAAGDYAYDESHDFCSYLARGRYWEQLETWLGQFPASSVLVMRSESYYADPGNHLRRVFDFVGIDADVELPDLRHMNRLPARPLEPRLRGRLNEYYRPHVQTLQERLDRDFEWDLTADRV